MIREHPANELKIVRDLFGKIGDAAHRRHPCRRVAMRQRGHVSVLHELEKCESLACLLLKLTRGGSSRFGVVRVVGARVYAYVDS